ncbi:MAG: sensor histidine kinase [Gemmatimonadota bacterium]|nr:sensor histidine kinase [Gemmatimonadota bacterium]
MKREALSFRPHARLLTMLGEQLIKNERIALVELVRNAYDADADSVDVRFEDFNENMTPNKRSCIVVRDDGVGMPIETLRNEWMNPATPVKHLAKKDGRGATPGKGRIMQGEKGIGRFAVLKLGRQITIATRQSGDDLESVLTWNFSQYDEDFVSEGGEPKEIFLDEIRGGIGRSDPVRLADMEHGTIIEIRDLKGIWGVSAIGALCRDLFALTDPVSRITGRTAVNPLQITVFCNGERQPTVEEQSAEELRALIEDKAVLKIHGRFDSSENAFLLDAGSTVNGKEVRLTDSKITGLWVWRQHCRDAALTSPDQLTLSGLDLSPRDYACGDFVFHFFIFDFARGVSGRHVLNIRERKLLKDYRIYLYRDGVRVLPYGDPDDDWLEIDKARATARAGNFFSNDQTVGWIDITHRDNPRLRDKTSREGLIDTGGATRDLIFLAKVFLSYLKQYPFARYRHKRIQRSTVHLVRDRGVARALATVRTELREAGHRVQAKALNEIEKDYKRERQHLVQRAEITEDLAGVGLSVEMASHDIMLLLGRGRDITRGLARAARVAGQDEISALTDRLIGVLQQVVEGMGDVQTLFKASRRRRKRLRVAPLLDKIYQIYKPLLDERNIRYSTKHKGKSPLVASTTDGVVMQVLINLFDNAAYWLESTDRDAREIIVTVDSDRGELIFSDTGPGIDPEDLPYIFDAFYTGKGQEGRGLGLYIARQLLERHDYRIGVAHSHDKVLSGANFLVSFLKEES